MGTFLRTFLRTSLRTSLMFGFFKLGETAFTVYWKRSSMEPTLGGGYGFDAARQIKEAQASQRKRWLQATWTCTWRKARDRACGPKGSTGPWNAAPVKSVLAIVPM